MPVLKRDGQVLKALMVKDSVLKEIKKKVKEKAEYKITVQDVTETLIALALGKKSLISKANYYKG